MTHSKGFTIIELIVVVVIISILSAIAIPKYLDMSADARAASIKTAYGAVTAASSMVRALYLAPGTGPASVTMDNISINTVNGYAASANTGGIATAAGITDGGGVKGTYSVTIAGSTTTISIYGATTPASCQVVYNAATSTTSPPVISFTTTGC